MTCLHRISRLHFSAQQWALAKEYSQCRECEDAAEGRRRARKRERRRRERRGREADEEDGEAEEEGDVRQPVRQRGITRAAWLASRLERLDREEEEERENERMLEQEEKEEEQAVREPVRAQRKAGVAFAASEREEKQSSENGKHSDESKLEQSARSGATQLRRDELALQDEGDGAQTDVEDAVQRRRRGKADGTAAVTRKRRRRKRDSDSESDNKRRKRKKKRKYNLAPEINPYNRNFTAQQPLTNSRTGRLGASAATNTPPPLPLQPDILTFLRSAFGLNGVDHLHSSQVHAAYAKSMEQTGTMGNGKVFVSVSGVNTLDNTADSEVEGAPSVRRTRQHQKAVIKKKGKAASEWQPMLGLFAGRAIEKDEVVTTYGGVLVDGDDARRRHPSTYTHIRRIRDSRMVRDGRLFSALFDRTQVDMYDQFNIERTRRLRKRLLPACGAEHVVTALSMEGHEDEMRVGLILLDALHGDKGALYGQRMEAKVQQQLLTSIMAHIGDQSTIISGEALKQIDGRRFLGRVRGPALIINEPSAIFYSSSPNPYSSRSGVTDTEGEQVYRDKSLDISYLFPFPIRPLLLPPLVLHPLPQQRHKALRELTQNMSDSARQLLSSTCGAVQELVYTSGMGYMANTGSKRECNVRVIEVNPRRDGLAPNEIFYVSSRRIAKGEEILAPYNNNESKSKRMGARMKSKGKVESESEEEAEDEAEGGAEEEEAAEKADERAKDKDEPKVKAKWDKMTNVEKARASKRAAIERKKQKIDLLRLRALQRSARKRGEDTAAADADERKEGEEAGEQLDNDDSPAPGGLDPSSPAFSSPSPSPSFSVSSSPPTSTSPAPSFSPAPPAFCSTAVRDASRAMEQAKAAAQREQVEQDAERERRRVEKATLLQQHEKRTAAASAAIELIDVEAFDSDDSRDAQKGYSILKRRDSPWMPPTIFEQRTRARSVFGGEVPQPSDVGIVVSFQQMNKQQKAAEFERRRRDAK